MFTDAPTLVVRLEDALKRNQLRFEVDDVQHAKRFRVGHSSGQATVLIFHTGTVLVQGSPSFLKTWLLLAKRCIEANQDLPAIHQYLANAPE